VRTEESQPYSSKYLLEVGKIVLKSK